MAAGFFQLGATVGHLNLQVVQLVGLKIKFLFKGHELALLPGKLQVDLIIRCIGEIIFLFCKSIAGFYHLYTVQQGFKLGVE